MLFASLLYKIGIHPILVMKPGHMFVGYLLDEGHKQFEFLETTMFGAGPQPGSMNIAFSPGLSLFYKTLNGADVGDLYMSLIHTCDLNDVNPFDYLTEL